MILSIDDIVKSEVESFIPDESYYKMFATPLKPPSAYRNAHRDNLMDFFKFEEMHEQLEEAPKIILHLMPNYLSEEEFNKIKNELNKSINQFILIAISMGETSEKPIVLQEFFGITNDSLLRIYELGVDLVKKDNYKDAVALFVFLTTMTPYVPSFWIAQGVCLQAMDRHEDAIEVFKNAKILKRNDPVPSTYIIESYLNLKNKDEAKVELDTLKNIVSSLEDDKKKSWEQKIKEIAI
jgi:tetratricopeptide (TPR) repeat protein